MDTNRLKKHVINFIIYAVLLIGLLLLLGSGCTPKLCPTYDSAIRAKHQKSISKVDKYNADFCKVKRRKHKKPF